MTALDVSDRPAILPSDEDLDSELGGASDAPSARGSGPFGRWRRPESINWPEVIITFVVVAFMVAFTFKYLQPSKLFLNTTPTGGDMGAHVWQPAYMRDHLLTHLRLTGWAPDWYAGFPSLVFYFPLPSFMIVLLNAVMPYNVAFKLITVLGLLTLPVAAWLFGKLARFRFPGPACLAAATLPFLFSRNFTIYGGNIASTLAGEFGFSISLSAAFIFLGLVARGLETGKYRALAAVLLVVTGLCHLLPAIFAIVGALVLFVLRWDRRSWRWMTPVFVVAAGLSAFWWLPFALRLPYATDMGYQKVTQYKQNLFPAHMFWLFVLAFIGFVVSLIRRQKLGNFLSIMVALSFVVFRYAPQARLWNARVLPFWFICLYLLAGVAIAEGTAMLLEPLRGGPIPAWSRYATLSVPLLAGIAVWIWVGFPLHGFPGGSYSTKTGKYSFLGISWASTTDTSFVPAWASWNYSGYESSGKARMNEYFGLIKTMKQVGQTNGCGRAMWEYEPQLNEMGTPDALMLLPYWTDSCIGSMEGLYYESSATTPYHFLNAAELSEQPSDPVRGLNYPSSPDVVAGVRHLQLMGVKYYMAETPALQTQADADPDLRVVATSGPWPVNYSGAPSGITQRTWKIYQISNSQIVAPLINQPVVMKGIAKGGKQWLDASEAWYLNDSVSDVMYTASGPKAWARVAPTSVDPPRTALQPVQVSAVTANDSSVSFNVDTIGVPVLVKVSYFPNWQAHGAQGPFRVAPNLMIVIPTSHHVWLHYGNTPVDWIGYLFGIMGLLGLVFLVRAEPVVFASTKRGLASPATPAAVTGVYEAYGRLQQELSMGLGGGVPPGPGGGDGTHDMDAWLGFPAGFDPGTPANGSFGLPPAAADHAARGGDGANGAVGRISGPAAQLDLRAGPQRPTAPEPKVEPVFEARPADEPDVDDGVVWLGSSPESHDVNGVNGMDDATGSGEGPVVGT